MKFVNNDKQLLILIGLSIIAILLWNTILIYPIKLFVVLLHEVSHGLMAVLVGGKILKIQISPQIGGYCQYAIPQGWLRQILIASAGYLGSLFWGGLILILATKMKKDRTITLIIGILMLAISFYVIKTGELFGIVFIFVFAAIMILSYKYLPDWFHDYFLKFIGLTSCFYVIIDILQDLIFSYGGGSDADKIAQLTFIPSIVVGILWMAIALVMLYYVLNFATRHIEK